MAGDKRSPAQNLNSKFWAGRLWASVLFLFWPGFYFGIYNMENAMVLGNHRIST